MARKSPNELPIVTLILSLWRATASWPTSLRYGLLTLLALAGLATVYLVQEPTNSHEVAANPPVTGLNPDGSANVLFCTWNVENLFDDKTDDGRRPVDRSFDEGFSDNRQVLQLKLDRLATALLRMNDGRGPDIISCQEVESIRAADLLRETLNRKLDEAKADPTLKYTQISMKNIGNGAGRHIAPGVITRLEVAHSFTKLHGRNLRILETRLFVNGHELCIVSSHWTSQIRQRDGSNGEEGRDRYGDTIFEVFSQLYRRNPQVDFIVCGDFNDEPEAEPVVSSLRAIGDGQKVISSEEPLLLNLLFGKPGSKYGTLWYGGKSLIYDQICVSKGMLDEQGWSVDPDSIRTYTDGLIAPGATRREPWRYGDPNNEPKNGRGYSDHFPVIVTLKVQPPAK